MMTQIERIARMEGILDEAQGAVRQLEDAFERYQIVKPQIEALEAYYTSEQWMKDYHDDSDGKLPGSLKRGVLSEDAVYDLLKARDELEMMLKKSL